MEIPEQLTLLAELSRVEARWRDVQQKLEMVPAEAKKLEDEADGKRKAFAEIDRQRMDVDKQRQLLERSLGEARDHLKKWNARLEKIRDEREHGALLSEIGGQKKAISRLENDILELMEKQEELEKECEGRQKAWDAAAASAKGERDRVKGTMDELSTTAAAIAKQRGGLSTKLPPALLKKYERIAEKRQGQAVAIIKGEVCSACNNTLPPQLCLLVYKGAVIESCQICARILVHESMTRSGATDDAKAEASA